MSSPLRHPIVHTALALSALLGTQAAQATVLDFEDIACARTQALCGAGENYSAKGYTLRYAPAPDDAYAAGFHAVGRAWPHNVGGSTALLANGCNATTTMTADSGKTFSVMALDLAEANGDNPASVDFIGHKMDGTQVRMNVKLDGKVGWQRVVFPSTFYNLTSLVWVQGDCVSNKPQMVDNIFVQRGITPAANAGAALVPDAFPGR